MFRFLETDIREQKNIKIEYKHLWINTVNDLHCEINFVNRVKDKNNFFIKWKTFIFLFKQKYIFHSWRSIFLRFLWILLPRHFFLPRQILKNIDMPQQKAWHLLTAKANFERCSWLSSISKWSPLKVFSPVILLLLTLRMRSLVWNLIKNAANFTVLVCCTAAN